MILDNNCSSLAMAISTNHPLIAQVDPWDRSTLLHIACASSPDVEIVGILLKAGADPNALDDVGRSSLHNAYIFSVSDKLTIPVVDLLLSHGAKREIKDNYGKTPYDYRK
jgi:ankyrin repeat protein